MGRKEVLEFLERNPDKFFSMADISKEITAKKRTMEQLRKFNEVHYIRARNNNGKALFLYKHCDRDLPYYMEKD